MPKKINQEIFAKINKVQPIIKELRKYNKYCKDIKERL